MSGCACGSAHWWSCRVHRSSSMGGDVATNFSAAGRWAAKHLLPDSSSLAKNWSSPLLDSPLRSVAANGPAGSSGASCADCVRCEDCAFDGEVAASNGAALWTPLPVRHWTGWRQVDRRAYMR